MADTGAPVKQLIYFADPMCSWCWGFSPVITRLAEITRSMAELRIILGGLRAFNTKVMDDGDKAYIANHWRHVNDRTGQPFNHAFFDRENFIYDTEPPCRAIVAVRHLAPDHALAMLERLHCGFYLENQDITDRDTLCLLAGEVGISPKDFVEVFDANKTKDATKQDFLISNKTGVGGFPTLLAGDETNGFRLVTTGYQDLETLERPVRQLLEPAEQIG